MIKKTFRILKHKLRWYKRDLDSDNIFTQIREEFIGKDIWDKAVKRFKDEGLPLSIYENHDHSSIIGNVLDIEAKDDGLYVTKHSLFEKGKNIIRSGKYTLPSIDAVIYKDADNKICDLELFGISLVSSAGAKNVELVTMGKYGEKIALSKIKEKTKKEDFIMDKNLVWQMFEDDDFIKDIPEGIIDKVIENHKDYITEKLKNMSLEDEAAITELDDDTEEEKIKNTKETKEAEVLAMSKFDDQISFYEVENNCKAIPSSIKRAKTFIKRNHKNMGDKSIGIALSELEFYGHKSEEKILMGKLYKEKTLKDITTSILKY